VSSTPVCALTIAGSDSGGGAGIQADLKTFAAHGVYGLTAITAVTAQNTRGVTAVEVLSPGLVTAQIEAVAADFQIGAAKTGMLASAAIVEAVANAVRAAGIQQLVVDPVMVAKSGDRLLDDAALGALTRRLLPQARLLTPNLPEAAVLAGMQIQTADDQREAARRIVALGARAVIVKGGHAVTADIVDLLYEAGTFTEFRHERVPGTSTHGTGCTFAAAITAHLALGLTIAEAIPLAQGYVAEAIRRAPGLGSGHGPMGHLWVR
jgi:hydroxymethylpyrimidine/phosphomethylpyrimidine kinase